MLVKKNLPDVLNSLEHDIHLAIEWFDSNYMKLNNSKCDFLISGHKFEHLWVNVGGAKVWESKHLKLLGVEIDNSLKFDSHVSTICNEASKKLSALTRLVHVLPFQKMRLLMKSFFESQFSYCPWMFVNRVTNRKVNRLHEQSLRILCKDDRSSYAELLQKDNSVTIHTRNIHKLATEMYKIKHNISPNYISDIFPRSYSTYNLRLNSDFRKPVVNTVMWGSETLRNIGPKIWELLPLNIKESPSLKSFKIKVQLWKPENCPCRPCRDHIPNLGFL